MKTNHFNLQGILFLIFVFNSFTGLCQGGEDPDQLLHGFLNTGSPEYANKLREEFPGSPQEKFCNAWEYIEANKDIARQLAQELVRDHPDFAPGYFLLGAVLTTGFEDYAGSAASLDSCIRLDPGFTLAYQYRGLARMGLGQFRQAKEDFDVVLESRRGYATGFLLRGVANYNLEDEEAMKADFEIGMQLDFRALSTIPGDLADEAMDRAIEAAPENAIYYYARGYASFIKGNYRSAASDFRTCIQLVPGSSDFYKYSGACKMHLEDLEGGQTDLNYALSVNPDDPETYYFLGILMNDFIKQPAMAREYMSLAIDLDNQNGSYYYERSKAEFRLMNYENAGDDINRALALDRTKGDFYALRGNIKMKIGSPPDDYCPDFNKALEWGTSYNLKRAMKKHCN